MGVVAAREGDDSFWFVFIGNLLDEVGGTAELEAAAALEVVALEVAFEAGCLIQTA